MSDFPETRESLIIQVQDPANQEAWNRFAELYRPVIYRIALAKGLQDADATDLSQQVLISVAGAVRRYEKRGDSVRFRHWLSRVTRNAVLNALSRKPKDLGVGGSTVQRLLDEVAEPDAATDELLTREYRRELYRRASKEVRGQIKPETWTAFELTVVQSQPIEAVAEQMGRSVGSIYTARSRVMFRLRETIAALENEEESR